MKIKESFLALFGMTSERYEKLSEAEQANLVNVSDQLDAAQTAQADAERDLATSQARVTELEGELAQANEARDTAESSLQESTESLSTAQARIEELEGEVTELNTRLEKKPGEASTTVIKTSETVPGQKKRTLKSWEVGVFKS